MTKSPLQFAKDFARLQSRIASSPSGDSQLLLALEFWPEMRRHRGDVAYQSYFDEYLPLLSQLTIQGNLIDLTISELQRLHGVLAKFDPEKSRLVALELAKQHFYVGALEEGLDALSHSGTPLARVESKARTPSPPAPLPPEEGGAVGQNPQGFDRGGDGQAGLDLGAGIESTDEFAAFRSLCAQAEEQAHPLTETLRSILTEWQGERESAHHDRARCLFVERDDTGRAVRGRMRSLTGRVELFRKSATTDEITFEGTIRTPDDPFVGAAYDACTAVRAQFGGAGGNADIRKPSPPTPLPRSDGETEDSVGQAYSGPDQTTEGAGAPPAWVGSEPSPLTPLPRGEGESRSGAPRSRQSEPRRFRPTRSLQGSHYYHAHYTIEDSAHTFTGDSIELAFALVAYVQLLRPEVARLDRLLSGEVAFTGGIDAAGALLAVNNETIGQKIERAFFSPVKYLVLPEANAAGARQHLDRLRNKYPRRHLHLITADRLSDIVEDHNVVRSEKVCIGEFVAKKAARYGRMTRVQVPLLLVLAYLLLCLLYPKAWVGFDWNPGTIRFIENGFVVCNGDLHELWRRSLPKGPLENDTSFWAISDLDGDGAPEVVVMPKYTSASRYSGWVFAYNREGDTLFTRDCVVRGEYPLYRGERDRDTNMYDLRIQTFAFGGARVLVAQTYREYPDRGMIRFLDSQGNYLGSYVNAGGVSMRGSGDVDGDGEEEPIFFGYNQLLGCSVIFALSPDSSLGVSPPYDAPELDLSQVKRGNQLRYVLLRPTDLGKISLRAEYNDPRYFFDLGGGTYRASTNEADMIPGGASVDYYFDVRLRVTQARLSDPFVKQRHLLVEKGLLKDMPQPVYEDMLRDSVTYWTGSEYVNEGQLRAQGK